MKERVKKEAYLCRENHLIKEHDCLAECGQGEDGCSVCDKLHEEEN